MSDPYNIAKSMDWVALASALYFVPVFILLFVDWMMR